MRKGGPDLSADALKLHPLICTTFVFCYLWSIGGNIIDSNWDAFDTYVRKQFDENGDAKVNIDITKLFFNLLLYHEFSKTIIEQCLCYPFYLTL